MLLKMFIDANNCLLFTRGRKNKTLILYLFNEF